MIAIGGYYSPGASIPAEIDDLRELGLAGLKFKVGGLEPEQDAERFRAARERMLDGWYLWPLIEYEHALERARRWRDVRQAAINGAADAIRESYLHQSVAA